MPRRAYSYRRLSYGGRQARGSGLERQEIAAQLCQVNGWILDDTLHLAAAGRRSKAASGQKEGGFVDSGRSAYHKANLKPTAGLGQILKFIERGRITPGEVLIVENLDRLSRAEIDDAYDLFRGIIKAGIWIATWEPRRIYTRESSGNMLALLEPLFIFARANEESSIKSVRTRGAWEKNRREGATMHLAEAPAWLMRTKDGYRPIPERVAVVRRIFEMTRAGHGQDAIAYAFETEGVPPLGRSGKWNGKYVQRIVRGRQVLGEYQPHQVQEGRRVPIGPVRKGHYPAVIDEQDWLAAQVATERRRRHAGRPAKDRCNLFSGLLYDADSREPLHVRASSHRGGVHHYLTTDGKGGASVRYETAQRLILDHLELLRPEDVTPPSARQKEHDRAVAELAARHTALEYREQKFIKKAATDLSEDEDAIFAAIAEVSQERKAVAKQLERLKLDSLSGRAEALAEFKTLKEMREKAGEEERRELDMRIRETLPTVVSSIWAKGQRVSPKHQIVHLQIWLHSGKCHYLQIFPGNLHGIKEEDWSAADFRRPDWRGGI